MTQLSRFSSAAALAAAMSMAAAPVAAAELPNLPTRANVAVDAGWDSDATNVERHRRYRGRNRIDGGDILAGVLILGGIAAIASAASNSSDNRRYREQPTRYRSNSNARSGGGQGIDRAVDMCLREIERDVRVSQVDEVERSGEGWRVSGSLYNGEGFTCQIGSDGRIDNVDYLGSNTARGGQYAQADRQWSDDRYAAARNNAGTTPAPSANAPAYPGGPVAGEEGYAEDDYQADDGRYGTSESADFGG